MSILQIVLVCVGVLICLGILLGLFLRAMRNVNLHVIEKAAEKQEESEQDAPAREHRKKARGPVTIEIGILDETLINMTDEQRIAHLDGLGKAQQARLDQLSKEKGRNVSWYELTQEPAPNPFPDWVKTILRKVAKNNHGEASYDHNNQTYALYVIGDKDKIDEICDQIDKEIIAGAQATEETRAWKSTHRMQMRALMADEHAAMDALRATLEPGGGGVGAGRNQGNF